MKRVSSERSTTTYYGYPKIVIDRQTGKGQAVDLGRAVHCTLGQYPGLGFTDALQRALSPQVEDFGCASTRHVQLCPQNFGELTDETLSRLRAASPYSRFRLHANCRPPGYRTRSYDASIGDAEAMRYFAALAAISRALGADTYSLHAGRRANATLEQMAATVRSLQELFGHRVAVEGLYPARSDEFLLSSWAEYAWLLESGLDFAIDVSHLNIVACRSGRIEKSLTRELLASEHCLEVHLSGNDGFKDSHVPLCDAGRPWWLEAVRASNPRAIFFSEGNWMRPLSAWGVVRNGPTDRRRAVPG